MTAEPQPTPEPPSVEPAAAAAAPTGRERSSWWVVFAGALFVIGVATAFSYLMSEDPAERGDTGTVYQGGFADNFDRPASDQLGGGRFGTWRRVDGGWGIQLGVAYLRDPDPVRNVAVIGAEQRASRVAATVSGTGVCGVVARFTDDRNYVAMVRVAKFGVWNVVEVRDGTETVLGTVNDLPALSVGVALSVGDDVVTAEVGLQHVSIAHRAASTGSEVGLIAQGDGAGGCTWDDFSVQYAD